MAEISCRECGVLFMRANGKHIRCHDCYPIAASVIGRCGRAVKAAIKAGKLASLSESSVDCADCGSRASVYDHRDYEKPLDVVAVCHGCNLRRGPAARLTLALVVSVIQHNKKDE